MKPVIRCLPLLLSAVAQALLYGQGEARPQLAAPLATIQNFAVSPATLNFAGATDPDVIGVSSPVVASFRIRMGLFVNNWNLQVATTGPPGPQCGTVTGAALTATCQSVTHEGASSGACLGAMTLSGTPQTVASGNGGLITSDFTVTLSFRFTDSWSYRPTGASPCTFNLIYYVNLTSAW